MISTHALLVYSPLNDARRPALLRLKELHQPIWLLYEGALGSTLPDWATKIFSDCITIERRNLIFSLEKIEKLATSRKLSFSGIITLSETGVYFCAQLADQLGLEFPTLEVVRPARNKVSMRSLFAEKELPTVPYGICKSLQDALFHAKNIGYPVVLKPILAGGSLFVTRVNNDTELTQVFDNHLTSGINVIKGDPMAGDLFEGNNVPAILVEKLIEGRTLFETNLNLPVGEVSIEGCVINGQTFVLGMHDKPLPDNGPHFEEVLWSTPSRLPGMTRIPGW